jgi:hypothetical protein
MAIAAAPVKNVRRVATIGVLLTPSGGCTSSAVTIRLTGRAHRWVGLLQEFGHLDTEGADRLLVAVAELHADMGGEDGAIVDLPLVRRAAAMLLVPTELPEGLPALLDDDWPLFFS